MPGQTPPVLEALSLEQFFKNAGMDAEHVEKYCAAIQQTNAVPAEPSLQDLSQLSKRNSWSFLGTCLFSVSVCVVSAVSACALLSLSLCSLLLLSLFVCLVSRCHCRACICH
jgi:hypothetical protein